MKKYAIVALGLALTSGAALAQSTPTTPATPNTPVTPSDTPVNPGSTTGNASVNTPFAQLDRNTDGMLSRDELKNNKDLVKRFQSLDINRDGNLSEQEYSASASGSTEQRGMRGSASGSASTDEGAKGSANTRRE